MMRGDILVADTLTQMSGHSLREASRIHKDKGRVVLANQLRQSIVNFVPNLSRHHCLQRRFGQLNRDVEFSRVTAVDDGAAGNVVGVDISCADEKFCYFFNWFLRSGETDANQCSVLSSLSFRMLADELFETFDRESKVRTALVADDCVNLVENEGSRCFQHPAPAFTGQQDVE